MRHMTGLCVTHCLSLCSSRLFHTHGLQMFLSLLCRSEAILKYQQEKLFQPLGLKQFLA